MSSVLLTIGAFGACILMMWGAHRIEPHWVSKEGDRFLTTCVPIDRLGKVIGRRREIRCALMDNGSIMLTQRHLLKSTHTEWRIEAKGPTPPSGKELYVLRPVVPAADGGKILLRVPAKSEVVPALDARSPGTDIRDRFPDRDEPAVTDVADDDGAAALDGGDDWEDDDIDGEDAGGRRR